MMERAESAGLQVHLRDGRVVECPGATIDAELSAAVFGRTGEVLRIVAQVPDGASLLAGA